MVYTAKFPHTGIRLEQLAVLVGKVFEVGRTDFLFTFDNEFDIDGHTPAHLLERVDGADARGEIAFVVGDAAPKDFAVVDFSSPRVCTS